VPDNPPSLIHIHGVSVGELLSAVPVIAQIMARFPQAQILLTSWTKTSQAQAQRLFGTNPRIAIDRLPMDLPWNHGAFYRKHPVTVALWIDSEIWPGWLMAMHKRRIPAALINGRMSDRSWKRWRRLRGAAKHILSYFTRIDAQSAQDAARFTDLGGAASVQPVNLKYLRDAPEVDHSALADLQARIGARPVIAWLSTHDGDEGKAFVVHARLKSTFPDLLTLITPRHAHRTDFLVQDAIKQNLTSARRSAPDTLNARTDILFGDTMGEMGLYLRLAPIVVMGKSFNPVKPGGQSPIEPGQLGRAILCGPYMTNFPGVMDDFRAANAILDIANEDTLVSALTRLVQNPAEATAIGDKAAALCTVKRAAGPAYIDDLLTFIESARV
jgi:3-deoxy-D-manno-octulosonic-acid transferase